MQYRIKKVPGPDDKILPVVQYKWLGLIWRDLRPATNRVNKLQREVIDMYSKLLAKLKEVEYHESEVKRMLDEVKAYGDPMTGTGPTWSDKQLPVFVAREEFIPPIHKDFSVIKEIVERQEWKDPDDLGIDWPPKDKVPKAGLTRSAYVLGDHWLTATVNSIVAVGDKYSHVLRYKKPDEGRQQQQQGRKGKGNQQQQQQQGNNSSS